MDVCVVGSCIQDLISYTKRFAEAGESVRGWKFETGSGGKGANQAVMAARLGASAFLLARVGNDMFGPINIESMRAAGVDVQNVEMSSTSATGTATITVSDNGENAIVVVLGANAELSPKHVEAIEEKISQSKVVCCQFEIPCESSTKAFEIARKHNVITLLNPAPGIPDLDKSILKFADIVVPNENEARMLTSIELTNIDDAKRAANEILKYGPETAIVTMGAQGVVLAQKHRQAVHITVPNVTAVDTTGAGDCFVGSLAFYLAKMPNLPMSEKVKRAAQIASMSVEKSGTQKSYPCANDIDPNLLTGWGD